MIKVMIVDDEILVRVGLRSTISWEEFGFAVVADAANGNQAIERFAAADPDILITDIRMPGMDGIELLKVLKERKPQLKTVILTNYDNFEYAKQALKLGADEYLLKTALDNEALFPVLRKLQTEIERETEQDRRYQQLQQKVLTGLPHLKKHFAECLLTGKINPAEWKKFLNDLNFKWEGRLFQLVLLKGKLNSGAAAAVPPQSLHLIEEIAEKIQGALVWESPRALEWVIIYNFEPGAEANYGKQVIPFNIRQVKTCLKQYFQIAAVAVFGPLSPNYARLAEDWQKLRKLAEYRIFWPEKELIFSEDIPAVPAGNYSLGLAEKNLTQSIRRGDQGQVKTVLDQLFDKVMQCLSPPLLYQVWHELLGEIFRFSREYGLSLAEIVTNEEQNSAYLDNFSSIFEIRDWFYGKFNALLQQIANRNAKLYSFPIRLAIAYLEENFARDVKLEALAQQAGLSKNHLCTLFRSETGQNFVEYLHRLRIARARELLETTDLRISEVGQAVGYGDAKYFTKVFQKYQNCSPTEYRGNCG